MRILSEYLFFMKNIVGDFLGGSAIKTPNFQCKGHGFDP